MDILKKLRLAKNLTQQQVASEINLSQQAYANYESGNRQPSYEMLIKIAEYFNVSIDYLLTGKEYIVNADFYRILLSDNGLNAIRAYLKDSLNETDYETLRQTLGIEFDEIRQFIDLGIPYGEKCLNILDKILVALDLNVYDIFKAYYRSEEVNLLTETERKLLKAYRNKPNLQQIVNTALGIDDINSPSSIADDMSDTVEKTQKIFNQVTVSK